MVASGGRGGHQKRVQEEAKDDSFWFFFCVWGGCPWIVEYIRGSLCATLSAFKTRVWLDPTIVSFSVCHPQGGRERERGRQPFLLLSNLLQLEFRGTLKTYERISIHSCLPAQQSSSCYFSFSSFPTLLTADPIPFPVGFNRTRSVCRVFIECWSGQSHHGHVPGAECASGALGALFAWCGHGGSCGGM